MKYLYIDFEYNTTNEKMLNLVSCAAKDGNDVKSWWLYNNVAQKDLREYLYNIKNTHTIVCYNALAEGRSFISLGLNPMDFTWIDLMYLWKQIKNSNDRYQYGNVLNKKGEKIVTVRPNKKEQDIYNDYTEEEEVKQQFQEARNSLVDCVYGITGNLIDHEHKDVMRDIIIANKEVEENKTNILNYNISDLDYMQEIKEKMLETLLGEYQPYTNKYGKLVAVGPKIDVLHIEDVLHHSKCVAAMSIIEANGIPIRMKNILELSKNYDSACVSLIDAFQDRHTAGHIFQWDKRAGKYVEKQEAFDQIVINCGLEDVWPRSDKSKKFKKDEKTLEKFGGVHEFFEELRQTKKALQQLKWYRPEALEEFKRSVGSDNRLRCYFGPYGTQTGRNAPPAKQFIFAQSNWLRAMIQPPEGKVIVSADWKSQEFMLSAWISRDANMKAAYEYGDIYVAYGKATGLFNGEYDKTNDEHKHIRNHICKPVVLGIGYGMGAKSLALRIKVTEARAQELIDSYYSLYSEYSQWKNNINKRYFYNHMMLKSADNWLLMRHNKNATSVLNFPIQSSGASCLRYSLLECIAAGLTIISPLHDAIYFECDEDDVERTINLIKVCMAKGVEKALRTDEYKIPVDIGIHKHNEIWIEEKGKANYNNLKKFCGLDLVEDSYLL